MAFGGVFTEVFLVRRADYNKRTSWGFGQVSVSQTPVDIYTNQINEAAAPEAMPLSRM